MTMAILFVGYTFGISRNKIGPSGKLPTKPFKVTETIKKATTLSEICCEINVFSLREIIKHKSDNIAVREYIYCNHVYVHIRAHFKSLDCQSVDIFNLTLSIFFI